MRRDSAPAQALLAHLTSSGVTLRGRGITGTALERLSRRKLLPPPGTAPERVAAHFALLDVLGYGPGCDPEHIARALLARGYPCEAARAAICAPLPEAGQVVSVAMLEAGFAMSAMAQSILDQVAAQMVPGGRTDHAGALVSPLLELPAERRAELLSALAGHDNGDDAPELPPVVLDFCRMALGEPPFRGREDPSHEEEDDAAITWEFGREAVWGGAALVSTASLAELAELAAMGRQRAAVLFAALGQHSTDAELDDAGAFMAPSLLYVRRRMSAALFAEYSGSPPPAATPWELGPVLEQLPPGLGSEACSTCPTTDLVALANLPDDDVPIPGPGPGPTDGGLTEAGQGFSGRGWPIRRVSGDCRTYRGYLVRSLPPVGVGHVKGQPANVVRQVRYLVEISLRSSPEQVLTVVSEGHDADAIDWAVDGDLRGLVRERLVTSGGYWPSRNAAAKACGMSSFTIGSFLAQAVLSGQIVEVANGKGSAYRLA